MKRNYYQCKFEDYGNDQKALFRIIDELLHSKDKHLLLQQTDFIELLNNISDKKIDKQSTLSNTTAALPPVLSANITAFDYFILII